MDSLAGIVGQSLNNKLVISFVYCGSRFNLNKFVLFFQNT